MSDTSPEMDLSAMSAAFRPPVVDYPRRNPAEWTYARLSKYMKEFQDALDDEHELGARLVSFGNTVVFHVESLGYHGPDIITFQGANENGERVRLIQNISQLSVLLVAVKKLGEKPRRIGFVWDEGPNGTNTTPADDLPPNKA